MGGAYRYQMSDLGCERKCPPPPTTPAFVHVYFQLPSPPKLIYKTTKDTDFKRNPLKQIPRNEAVP